MTDQIPTSPAVVVPSRLTVAQGWAWAKRRSNVLLFVGGFLFDVFTLTRIDSWVDLAVQLAYLTGLTLLIWGQHREAAGLWRPAGRAAWLWQWNLEALHFFYGGLLSNYVVFYAKSASGFRPLVFFGLLVALLFINEMPQIRRIGHRLRLGLYAFCVASFLIYFVPVIVGRMGDWTFALSILLAGGVVWGVARLLSRDRMAPTGSAPWKRAWPLAWPAFGVLVLLSALYALRLVPPVPLSVKFQGVYHLVQKTNGTYVLTAERPRFWLFWRKDSRPFRARSGDDAFYFARVFAPRRFHHRVSIRWEKRGAGGFVTQAVVPLSITGGRDQGFRAYASFSDIGPGLWRATVQTEDGRAVGSLRFRVVQDAGETPRRWIETRM